MPSRRLSAAATRYVAAVELIEPASLLDAGISLMLIDRDNTCVPRDTRKAPAAVLAWLDDIRAAGIMVCLVSNNFHTDQVRASAAELRCDAVDHAMKPAPFALERAMRMMGEVPERTVMVGDQVFTDVLAGNLAGARTILVRPQCRCDLWYTHIFRIFEHLALRGKKFEGE
ncbi:YqeG family HAD IIIA-type phosphatase [Paratractidigestivibacter sp.]|uniref:YqeG family HAD IIIA-type phosphatase n=1 Tax=Paratractidigestivibacter sp. TaxID=2847316 RepID=UPI002ABE59DA|nr:YqeG family HAD IIIA-type phosphatase [Paratractidigestivibacter sp.]